MVDRPNSKLHKPEGGSGCCQWLVPLVSANSLENLTEPNSAYRQAGTTKISATPPHPSPDSHS